jgi:hypothetical protein
MPLGTARCALPLRNLQHGLLGLIGVCLAIATVLSSLQPTCERAMLAAAAQTYALTPSGGYPCGC